MNEHLSQLIPGLPDGPGSEGWHLIVDYKKWRDEYALIHIDGAVMERIESFKFLSVHIAKDLSQSKHTKKVVKRSWQCLFPLRRLIRFGMVPYILKKLYSCTIESILTG
jgi:hypothetical protein